MYLELSYEFSKTRFKKDDKLNVLGYSIYDLNKKPLSFFKSLVNNPNTALAKVATQIIINYFLRREMFKVLKAISKVDNDELEILVENLILTKEVQQAEAKRRGHGAEFSLAKLINSLNVKMIPKERFMRAIGFIDPNVDRVDFEIIKKTKSGSWSFDLIVMDHKLVHHAFVQSLIHTSDPGQYGVNKSDETISIKKDLTTHNKKNKSKKELWGIVDGVGFCENKKDTIDKMLIEFDCFIQMKSLYKAGLQLHKSGLVKIKGISFDCDFYSKDEQECMFQKYCSPEIKNITNQKANADWTPISAGKATLFI